MGDPGIEVVDRDGEVVQRRAVGAGDHRIIHVGVGEARLAADDVVDERLAVAGHAQPDRARRLGLAAESPLGAVAVLERADVIGGGVGVIGVAAVEQLPERFGMARGAVGLEDRTLVEVQVEPAEGVEDLLHVLRRRSLPVGIFDAQDERAALAAREQPVVERGPGAADVQRAGWGRSKANSDGHGHWMLIGAHVSQAGGLVKAIERGSERGCQAIQIFNQSPRMWRPTAYTEDDFQAFRAAMEPSPVDAVLIHAVYLLNCASEDRQIRDRSLASLIQSLQVGAGIGAAGVVLHPGSAKQGDVGEAVARAGQVIGEALAETDGARCTWRTPPAPAQPWGARSRSWPTCWTPPAPARASVCAWIRAICWPPATTSAPPPG